MARIARSQDDFVDGVVQLRFSDEKNQVRDINAAELAEVLQGLVEFTGQMAKAGLLGDGVPPEVRVRPPREGSFIVEAVLQWVVAHPFETIGGGVGAGAVVTEAIRLGVRSLRGDKPKAVKHVDNGEVVVEWAGDESDQIPSQAWDRLREMKRPTRQALRKILAPLGDDEVDQLEVRDGNLDETTDEVLQSAPAVVAGRSDYFIAAAEVNEVEETVRTFDAEARLRSIDFRPGKKWSVETRERTLLATMEDQSFLLAIDRGMALHKNDIFEVTIREEKTVKNGRTSRDWALLAVRHKRRGSDDGDEQLSAPSST